MYFCPCSCSKPDCENEEDVLICLPRNLSYAGESYLDRYSVSSAYVHNAKLEKQLLNADVGDRYLKAGAAACAELRDIEAEEEADELLGLAAGGERLRVDVVGGGGGGGRGRGGGRRGEEGHEKKRGEEEEEEEEEEDEAGVSERLLGACACSTMATRPVTTYGGEESSPFFRTTGGPDHCCDVVVDTAPTSLIADMSLSASPPPCRSPDTDPEPDPDPHHASSSPPNGVNGDVIVVVNNDLVVNNDDDDHDDHHHHPNHHHPPLSPPSPPKLTVTIATRGGGGGGGGGIVNKKGCGSSTSSSKNSEDANTSSANARQQTLFERYVVQQQHHHQKPTESPDSDLVSEEGIFVNMMDDLDGLNGDALGGKSTVSEASDDTYVSGDSMYYSPEDVDDMDDMDQVQVRGQDLKVSLEEAVQQAAAFVFRGAGAVEVEVEGEENGVESHHGEQDGRRGGGGDDDDDDKNVFVVSLPRPHANDGESQDCSDDAPHSGVGPTDSEEDEEKKKKKYADLNPPGYSAGPSPLQVDPGVNDAADSAASDGQSNAADGSSKPPPQSPKDLGPLEINVADTTTTTTTNKATPPASSSLLNADGGAAGGGPKLGSSYHDLLSPNSPLYDDSEFNFQRTQLRKSTSLKSSKTPPGTPRRKKVVRFADAMGLDLESVRHVLNLESPPKIPASAMKDLQPGLSEDRKAMGAKYISETFVQPGVDPHFRERVLAGKVSLENALIVSGSITGVVRVSNIGFHKAVRIRFTTNGWASFHDIAASYMVNSNDGPTDRFSFTLVPPHDFSPGSRLEFAISYSVNGTDYWDNNFGQNYVFECYAKTVPTEAENAWMHFL